MCFCDNKYFKVINMTTGHIKLYSRAASIARRFGSSRDWVLYCLNHRGVHICRNRVEYSVEVNKHPECEEVRCGIAQNYGVRLGKIPDSHRHLLPEHRQ